MGLINFERLAKAPNELQESKKPGIKQIIDSLTERGKLSRNLDQFFIDLRNAEERGEIDFELRYSNPVDFELQKTANQELLPFIWLPDGSILGFWFYRDETIPIVYVSIEGVYTVVSESIDHFLYSVSQKDTGIDDIDNSTLELSFLPMEHRKKNLGDLQLEFDTWVESFTELQQPIYTEELESVRADLFSVAKAMISKGLSKVYKSDASWWSMDFKIKKIDGGFEILYLDYGLYHPIPNEFAFGKLVPTMEKYFKTKGLTDFDLSVWIGGGVSVNRDKELVILKK